MLGVLTEGYEELPVAPALVGGQCEDARHVVTIRGLLLLQRTTTQLGTPALPTRGTPFHEITS